MKSNKMKTPIRQHHLSVKQLHGALGGSPVVSIGCLYAAIKRREIPAITIGRRKLIPASAVRVWLDANHGQVIS